MGNLTKTTAEEFFRLCVQAFRAGASRPGKHIQGTRQRSAVAIATEQQGKPRSSANGRYRTCVAMLGREPDWTGSLDVEKPRIKVRAASAAPEADPPALETPKEKAEPAIMPEDVARKLRKKPMSIAEIAAAFKITIDHAESLIQAIGSGGVNLHRSGDKFTIDTSPPPSYLTGRVLEYVSRPDNTFLFGATSDNHLGSKYARLDVLNDLYDKFAAAGVDRVFNAGNWIDGEARFNKHDLLVHGMDAQCRYLAEHYPQRPGIETYAVAGDDHEGWYAQREGVDIGRYAERTMRDAGRTDWHDLGYMEAHIRLVNANTGAWSMLSCVHPGGGSAYALSYSIQKIIESLEGGEKPAVGLYGHYHKLWAGIIRGVWCLQTGCTEDQTPFMRKNKLSAHIGGAIVGLDQDPETGAITSMTPKMMRYFNKGYYNDRWSMARPAILPERAVS